MIKFPLLPQFEPRPRLLHAVTERYRPIVEDISPPDPPSQPFYYQGCHIKVFRMIPKRMVSSHSGQRLVDYPPSTSYATWDVFVPPVDIWLFHHLHNCQSALVSMKYTFLLGNMVP